MLRISGAGWAEIKIGEKVICEASYLTDVHIDFLKAFYDYFNKNFEDIGSARNSSSVYVDLEGSVMNFVFSDMMYSAPTDEKVFVFYPTYVKEDNKMKVKWKVDAFNIDPYYLALELVKDIEEDIDNWAKWGSYALSGEKAEKYYYDELQCWLEKLKGVLSKESSSAEKLDKLNDPNSEEYKKSREVLKKAVENLTEENIAMEHIEKHFPKK